MTELSTPPRTRPVLAPANRLIALPPLGFRVGVTGAAGLDDAASERLRPRIADVLGRVKAAAEALAADPLAAKVYASDQDGGLRPKLRLISPLGAGADRLVAEEALRLGYALEVPLPFAQAAYEGTFSDSVAEFRALLAEAGPRILTLDGDAADDLVRPRSYAAVGRLVVRNCDLLIAVWDNTKLPGGSGGTTDTVRFALHAGVPVWWLHADGAHPPMLLTETLHLAQPEDALSGDARLHAWLDEYLRGAILPPSPPDQSEHCAFARVARRTRAWRATESDPLRVFLDERSFHNRWFWSAHDWFERLLGSPKRGGGASRPASPSHPAAGLARLCQARYRSSYVYVFLLAAAALVSALVGLAFEEQAETFTTVAELAALFAIFAFVQVNHHQRWHERYISYRLVAELARMQWRLATLGWNLPGLGVSGLAVRSGRGWIGWHFAATVRAAPLPAGVLSPERLRAAQQELERDLLAGQIGFHERRRSSKERSAWTLQCVGEGLFIGTLVFVAVKAGLLPTTLGPGAARWLGLFAALLPAVSAAVFGIGAYEEMEVLAEQSERMLGALRKAEARVSAINVDRPLASQLLGAELFEVVTLMLADVEGWAQLFRMKAVGTG